MTKEDPTSDELIANVDGCQEAGGDQPPEREPQQATPEPEEEIAKYRESALRAHADLDNFRKRATREKEESIRYANASLLEKLLPMLDNFDLGLEAARSAGGSGALISGFEMVRRQLDEFLRTAGVEPILAEGSEFDPNWHEAMAMQPSSDIPEGVVIKQLRPGYKLRDRLLRPSGVIVSKGSASAGNARLSE